MYLIFYKIFSLNWSRNSIKMPILQIVCKNIWKLIKQNNLFDRINDAIFDDLFLTEQKYSTYEVHNAVSYLYYSQVSNKWACSFINFQYFAPSARFFPPCLFINFQKNFHPARLFHPCSIIPSCSLLPSCIAPLFLFYK